MYSPQNINNLCRTPITWTWSMISFIFSHIFNLCGNNETPLSCASSIWDLIWRSLMVYIILMLRCGVVVYVMDEISPDACRKFFFLSSIDIYITHIYYPYECYNYIHIFLNIMYFKIFPILDALKSSIN